MLKQMKKQKKKLAILVLLAAVLLGIAAEWMQKQESHFKENCLIRNEPGEGDYQESLNYIEEDSGEKGQIVLNLQERTLTADSKIRRSSSGKSSRSVVCDAEKL